MHPRKLNLGCGWDIRPGYLNVDSADWHKPDMIADITDLKELPSEYFEEIVALEVLEHIPRAGQEKAINEWARLLAPGGTLQVRVPSVIDMVAMLKGPEFKSVEQQHFWVQMLYGTQAYPGDFHLCGYTAQTLQDIGQKAGLVVVKALLKDRWLYDFTFRKISEVELDDAEWLAMAYVRHVNVCPDHEGYHFFLGKMRSGEMTRPNVEAVLAASG